MKIAWEGLQQILRKRTPDSNLRSDISRAFFYIHAFFNAQGTASNLLWPKSKKRPNLAAVLPLDDSSPLKPKEPRNGLVHVEERISEQWAKKNVKEGRRSSIFQSFGSAEAAVNMGFDLHDIYQLFDTTCMTAVFFGKKYRLRPIAEVVDQISDSAKQLSPDIRNGKYE
jgi:hypothetical protein